MHLTKRQLRTLMLKEMAVHSKVEINGENILNKILDNLGNLAPV